MSTKTPEGPPHRSHSALAKSQKLIAKSFLFRRELFLHSVQLPFDRTVVNRAAQPDDGAPENPGFRRLCLGETNAGRLLAFVVMERKGKLRFITAYPMHPKQREIYRGEEE